MDGAGRRRPAAGRRGARSAGRFVREYDWTLGESPDGLRLDHGLLDRSHETVPPGRVQTVRIVEPWLWRRLGWVRVELDVAGSDNGVLLPVADHATAREIIGRVLAGAEVPREFVRPPGRAAWCVPAWWRGYGLAVTDRLFAARHGLFHRTVALVPHAKVQSVRLEQGPWQRRQGVADLHVDTGASETVTAHLRDADEAATLLRHQADRSRTGRRTAQPDRWMTGAATGGGPKAEPEAEPERGRERARIQGGEPAGERFPGRVASPGSDAPGSHGICRPLGHLNQARGGPAMKSACLIGDSLAARRYPTHGILTSKGLARNGPRGSVRKADGHSAVHLWSLSEEIGIEDDSSGDGLVLTGPDGVDRVPEVSPLVREALRRMQLGPVLLANLAPERGRGCAPDEPLPAAGGDPGLSRVLASITHLVVRTLAIDDLGGPLLSAFPSPAPPPSPRCDRRRGGRCGWRAGSR